VTEIVRILLVEDNPADVDLTKESLEEAKMLFELDVVMDGEQASDFLHRRPPYEEAKRPDLILLDLNLPRKSGQELLKEVKASEALRRIPVVILTSSKAEADILKSYDLQASAYVTKPIDLAGFGKIVQGIEHFWLTVVRYPDKG
jgi:chemotaxis family two-component system response regulator Rcp1